MQARSLETQNLIMDAAAALFAEQGYAATSVSDICRAADVSKGAFYHHFPSKQALFLALLGRWLTPINTHMLAAAPPDADAASQFLALTSLAAQMFGEAKGQLPMFLEFWNQAARDPAVWQATIAPYAQYRARFAGMIADGVAAGSFRVVDAETGARVVVALAVGLLLQAVLEPDAADWGEITRAGVQLLLDGLRRRD